MSLVYKDDLYGYDGLFELAKIFPTFELWKEQLNEYMFFQEIKDEDLDKKIYNIIFKRYKNYFYKYELPSMILNKTSAMIEELYAEIAVITDFATKPDLTSTTTVDKDFKTNNSKLSNTDGFQTNQRETVVDNSQLYIDMGNNAVSRSSVINRRITDMRKLFMQCTNEVVIKDLYNK